MAKLRISYLYLAIVAALVTSAYAQERGWVVLKTSPTAEGSAKLEALKTSKGAIGKQRLTEVAVGEDTRITTLVFSDDGKPLSQETIHISHHALPSKTKVDCQKAACPSSLDQKFEQLKQTGTGK